MGGKENYGKEIGIVSCEGVENNSLDSKRKEWE